MNIIINTISALGAKAYIENQSPATKHQTTNDGSTPEVTYEQASTSKYTNDGSTPEVSYEQASTSKYTNDGSIPKSILMEQEVDEEQIILEVKGVKYTFNGKATDNYYNEQKQGNNKNKIIWLGSPPIIQYSRQKKIVVTEVGNNGDEIIEEWGMKSYELSIAGLLINPNHANMPLEGMSSLVTLFEGKTANVTGNIFRKLKIYSIYISEMSLYGIVGYTDTWEYKMQARSIHPISFILSV